VVQLASILGGHIPGLSSTVFFEHDSIDELAGYLLTEKRDALTQWLFGKEKRRAERIEADVIGTKIDIRPRRHRHAQSVARRSDIELPERTDVAIIGRIASRKYRRIVGIIPNILIPRRGRLARLIANGVAL
jgi:hypothetical protein